MHAVHKYINGMNVLGIYLLLLITLLRTLFTFISFFRININLLGLIIFFISMGLIMGKFDLILLWAANLYLHLGNLGVQVLHQ